jgi:hypothetical protein
MKIINLLLSMLMIHSWTIQDNPKTALILHDGAFRIVSTAPELVNATWTCETPGVLAGDVVTVPDYLPPNGIVSLRARAADTEYRIHIIVDNSQLRPKFTLWPDGNKPVDMSMLPGSTVYASRYQKQIQPYAEPEEINLSISGGWEVPVLDDQNNTILGVCFYPLIDAPAQTPKRAIPRPVNTSIEGNWCEGWLSRDVPGPETKSVTYGTWHDLGSYTVTADASAKLLKLLDIKISVGVVVKASWQDILWKKTWDKDVYKCRDGVWKFDHTERCTKEATGVLTIPYWYGRIVMGEPMNGYPTDPRQWRDTGCKRL